MVQPARKHLEAGKNEPEPSPFLLSTSIIVQITYRLDKSSSEQRVRVEPTVTEHTMQNTNHNQSECHNNITQRNTDLFLNHLTRIYMKA